MNLLKATLVILAINFGFAVTGYGQSLLTNGLVAYYPFNGSANDASGNGNNGIVFGSILSTDRFGESASAYAFGQSEYIACKDAPQLDFGPQTSFSVFAWIKFTGNVAGFQGIVSKMYDDSNPTSGFQIGIFQNTVQVQMGAPPALTFNGTLGLNDGKWHMVGLVRNGMLASIFIDGRGIPEAGVSDPTLVSQDMSCTNSLLFGVDRNLSRFFSGSIDDIRIHNRAFSGTEVQELFAYESGPRIDLIKIVQPSLSNLTVGTNYQLQVSTRLNTWTNSGTAFTATNSSMVYPQRFEVDYFGELFFRLELAP